MLSEFEPRVGAIGVENRAWSEQVLGLRQVRPDVELRLASEVIAPLRMVKEVEELRAMETCAAIVDQAMNDIIGFLQPDSGQTELDVAYEIDRLMVKHGADGSSFVTNVWQMGPDEERALAMKASRRPLTRGNSLSFDFGSTLDGYCYDFGRSVYLGEPPDEYRRVHALVMQAAQVGIEALQDGQRTAEDVDALARQVITDGGHGEWFRHRLAWVTASDWMCTSRRISTAAIDVGWCGECVSRSSRACSFRVGSGRGPRMWWSSAAMKAGVCLRGTVATSRWSRRRWRACRQWSSASRCRATRRQPNTCGSPRSLTSTRSTW